MYKTPDNTNVEYELVVHSLEVIDEGSNTDTIKEVNYTLVATYDDEGAVLITSVDNMASLESPSSTFIALEDVSTGVIEGWLDLTQDKESCMAILKAQVAVLNKPTRTVTLKE